MGCSFNSSATPTLTFGNPGNQNLGPVGGKQEHECGVAVSLMRGEMEMDAPGPWGLGGFLEGLGLVASHWLGGM